MLTDEIWHKSLFDNVSRIIIMPWYCSKIVRENSGCRSWHKSSSSDQGKFFQSARQTHGIGQYLSKVPCWLNYRTHQDLTGWAFGSPVDTRDSARLPHTLARALPSHESGIVYCTLPYPKIQTGDWKGFQPRAINLLSRSILEEYSSLGLLAFCCYSPYGAYLPFSLLTVGLSKNP